MCGRKSGRSNECDGCFSKASKACYVITKRGFELVDFDSYTPLYNSTNKLNHMDFSSNKLPFEKFMCVCAFFSVCKMMERYSGSSVHQP